MCFKHVAVSTDICFRQCAGISFSAGEKMLPHIVEAGGLFPAGESSSVLVARVVDILPAGGTHSDYHPDIPRAGAHQHLRYQQNHRSDAISQYRIF